MGEAQVGPAAGRRRLRVVLGAAACVLLAEGTLRIASGGNELGLLIDVRPPSETPCLRLRPGARASYTGWLWRIPPVEQEVNSQGFRGPERPKDKPGGVFRAALLGDSFTYGMGVREGETIAARMEERLREGRPKAEVLNFGIPASSLDDAAERLEGLASAWNPDLAVVFLYDDDLEPSPCRFHGGIRPLLGLAIHHVRLVRLGYMGFVALRATSPSKRGEADRIVRTRRKLEALLEAARTAGAGLAVVALGDPIWPKKSTPHLGALLDELGIPWLDARSWLAGPGALPVIPREYHLSEAGCAEAGRRTADWLRRENLTMLGSKAVPKGDPL